MPGLRALKDALLCIQCNFNVLYIICLVISVYEQMPKLKIMKRSSGPPNKRMRQTEINFSVPGRICPSLASEQAHVSGQ